MDLIVAKKAFPKRIYTKYFSKPVKKVLTYFFLILASVLFIIPFIWMISSSLKLNTEVFEFPIRWIPLKPRWENYIIIWSKINLAIYFLNTLKITLCVIACQLVTCSLAAYAFAKVEFPERDKLFLLYLGTMMLPYPVIMIPQFMMIKNLGLNDTHLAIILLNAFSPFGVFLLRQFFITIPIELSEAARIDGLNEFGIYHKILLSLVKPAITTLFISTFMYIWNDFLSPLIYLSSDAKKTIQIGMRSFLTQYRGDYAYIMVTSVCAILPVFVVFIFGQKYFIEGIATSGLKV